MSSKVQFNNVLCPVCKEECHNTWGLVEHMKDRHGFGRVNLNSGKLVAAIAAGLLAVSLLVAQPAKAQNAPQPTPTPTTAVGGGPQIIEMHRVYLPMIAKPEEGPEGQGRYWGGRQAVSWCPTCDSAAS